MLAEHHHREGCSLFTLRGQISQAYYWDEGANWRLLSALLKKGKRDCELN